MEIIKYHEMTPYEHKQRKLKIDAEAKAAKEEAEKEAQAATDEQVPKWLWLSSLTYSLIL